MFREFGFPLRNVFRNSGVFNLIEDWDPYSFRRIRKESDIPERVGDGVKDESPYRLHKFGDLSVDNDDLNKVRIGSSAFRNLNQWRFEESETEWTYHFLIPSGNPDDAYLSYNSSRNSLELKFEGSGSFEEVFGDDFNYCVEFGLPGANVQEQDITNSFAGVILKVVVPKEKNESISIKVNSSE